MRFNSLGHVGQRATRIRLEVALSDQITAAGAAAWQLRLRRFLRTRQPFGTGERRRFPLLPRGASGTPSERGVLIAWIVAQPEVVFISVDHRAASDNVSREAAHG